MLRIAKWLVHPVQAAVKSLAKAKACPQKFAWPGKADVSSTLDIGIVSSSV